MKIQVMAAKISAWGFFWTLFPMSLSVFCYLFILTPFAKLSPKLNHISDKKGYNTWCSQAVSHPSTNQALCCLTSVIGREPVHSTWYGRSRSL